MHNLPLAAFLVVEAANQNADPARRVEVVGCVTLSAGTSSAPCRYQIFAGCFPCGYSSKSMCLTSAQGMVVCDGSICGRKRSSRRSILRVRLQAENDLECS